MHGTGSGVTQSMHHPVKRRAKLLVQHEASQPTNSHTPGSHAAHSPLQTQGFNSEHHAHLHAGYHTTVFTFSEAPIPLASFQTWLTHVSRTARGVLRVKGLVWVSELRRWRCVTHLSGRQRIECVREGEVGGWVGVISKALLCALYCKVDVCFATHSCTYTYWYMAIRKKLGLSAADHIGTHCAGAHAMQWVSPPRTQLVLIGTDLSELETLKQRLQEACTLGMAQGRLQPAGLSSQVPASPTQSTPAEGPPECSDLLQALVQAHPQLRASYVSSSSHQQGKDEEGREDNLLLELQVSG
jgi:G3E family GTPase